jgi:hypothetical protein
VVAVSGGQPAEPAHRPANDHDGTARLRAEIGEELDKAGIGEDDPIRPLFVSLVDLFDRTRRCSENVVGRLDGVRAIADAEVALMKTTLAASEAQIRKVDGIIASVDVRAHELLTRTIDRMAGDVAERMRDRMVIVERRHNRWVLWRTGALIAVVLLGVLGGGYAWCAYADRNASALMERCLARPFQDPKTGQLFCLLGAPQPGQ